MMKSVINTVKMRSEVWSDIAKRSECLTAVQVLGVQYLRWRLVAHFILLQKQPGRNVLNVNILSAGHGIHMENAVIIIVYPDNNYV